MYNKSSPSTMTAEHHEEHPHEVIMTPDYFNFAFAMEDA